MQKILLLVLGVCSLFAACKQGQPASKQNEKNKTTAAAPSENNVRLTAEQIRNAGIELAGPEAKEMHTLLKVNGVIDVPPQNIVSVSMPLGGYLKSMKLLPGMQVSRGQVLAVLEDPQYIQLQQDYLMARSKLGFLETDFNRQKELNASKANSDKVFQQVKSDYESQRVLVRSLAEKLQLIHVNPDRLTDHTITSRVNIYSPLSGFVTKVNVNPGKYVSPTDVLFELINPGDIHLSLTVFEKDVLDLVKGQRVSCYTNNNPNEKYGARIHLITKNIGQDRSAEVHCHFDRYDKRLLPGMFMNAEVELDNAKVTAVPNDAVVRWENKNYVFMARGQGEFRMEPVDVGSVNGDYTEIKSTLPAGQIVSRNAYSLLMKMKNTGEEE
ncbi:efflux RND transporter periplasmic adaptor subunit [Niabella beijingensis]|uniref:efflux RND transporter periplasmic adaptor subunit n=1 Tax=Niabella beijingensis TaxID=2872700 RepID=UPI001CBE9E24|nr:efflux RND transporter periplasmic adaptor subunit [Niabella beijingensis]MBZ4192580.1 efflux RND transporter periplasmic adaptor subunit [Niabella beijingensis]